VIAQRYNRPRIVRIVVRRRWVDVYLQGFVEEIKVDR
jgi:hypothetical protein